MRFGDAVCSLLALALGIGCEADPALVVSLRSDFVAGVEVAAVDVRVAEAATGNLIVERRTDLTAGEDLLGGVRIAEADVPRGNYRVSAELLDRAGTPLVSRDVLATVSSATAVTVVITRACRGVMCPEASDPTATECRDGRCVRPECSPEALDACPDDSCATDADCPGTGVSCTSPICLGGGCGVQPDDAMCGAGETCDPDVGCVGAAGTGLITVNGSFDDCPRVPPYCVTRDMGVFTVFDPTDGTVCRGPTVSIDPRHDTAGMGLGFEDFAMLGDALHFCARDASGVDWAYRIDMATDSVEDVRLGGERCEAMFRDGPRLVAMDLNGFSGFPSWAELIARITAGARGDPLGMCSPRANGQLMWEVANQTRFGTWFTAEEIDTCELATGVEGTLPLVGFDDFVDGIWIGGEIFLLSRRDLVVFDFGGVEQRRVPIQFPMMSSSFQGLECEL